MKSIYMQVDIYIFLILNSFEKQENMNTKCLYNCKLLVLNEPTCLKEIDSFMQFKTGNCDILMVKILLLQSFAQILSSCRLH